MTHETRNGVIGRVRDAVIALRAGRPVRVAIEGRSAAGKSTFADELADSLRAREVDVLRPSIDDFHRENHKFRAKQGGWTPRLYYDEGYDYAAFRRFVLDPLGPDGDRRCRIALYDSFHNEWYPEKWQTIGEDAVALVDGTFLLRPELAGAWDLVIWLDIDLETMVQRAKRRDTAWVGSESLVEQRYRTHWTATHLLYEELDDPKSKAQIVVDHEDFDAPCILRFPGID
jgi:uridine kinase